MIEKCSATYSARECESTETARVRMNRDQAPQQHNYTKVGFKKVCTYLPFYFPFQSAVVADQSAPECVGPYY